MARTKPKKKSRKSAQQLDIEARYAKERNRISNYISRLKKENIYTIYDILPKKPQKITEGSIRVLQKITPKKILELSQYIEPETGTVISSALERRYEKKQEGIEKGKKTRRIKKKAEEVKTKYKQWVYDDNESTFTPPSKSVKVTFDKVVIANFEMSLNRWPPEVADKVKSFIDRLIQEDDIDESDVAMMIVNSQANGVNFRFVDPYKPSAVKDFLADMLEYLPHINDDLTILKDNLLTEIEQLNYEEAGWNTAYWS